MAVSIGSDLKGQEGVGRFPACDGAATGETGRLPQLLLVELIIILRRFKGLAEKWVRNIS